VLQGLVTIRNGDESNERRFMLGWKRGKPLERDFGMAEHIDVTIATQGIDGLVLTLLRDGKRIASTASLAGDAEVTVSD
jgi:hypothetical protein